MDNKDGLGKFSRPGVAATEHARQVLAAAALDLGLTELHHGLAGLVPC